jgi:hypothetical protein
MYLTASQYSLVLVPCQDHFQDDASQNVVEKLAIVVDNFEEKEAKTVPTKTVVPVAQFRDDNTSDSDKWYQGCQQIRILFGLVVDVCKTAHQCKPVLLFDHHEGVKIVGVDIHVDEYFEDQLDFS